MLSCAVSRTYYVVVELLISNFTTELDHILHADVFIFSAELLGLNSHPRGDYLDSADWDKTLIIFLSGLGRFSTGYLSHFTHSLLPSVTNSIVP